MSIKTMNIASSLDLNVSKIKPYFYLKLSSSKSALFMIRVSLMVKAISNISTTMLKTILKMCYQLSKAISKNCRKHRDTSNA